MARPAYSNVGLQELPEAHVMPAPMSYRRPMPQSKPNFLWLTVGAVAAGVIVGLGTLLMMR